MGREPGSESRRSQGAKQFDRERLVPEPTIDLRTRRLQANSPNSLLLEVFHVVGSTLGDVEFASPVDRESFPRVTAITISLA